MPPRPTSIRRHSRHKAPNLPHPLAPPHVPRMWLTRGRGGWSVRRGLVDDLSKADVTMSGLFKLRVWVAAAALSASCLPAISAAHAQAEPVEPPVVGVGLSLLIGGG